MLNHHRPYRFQYFHQSELQQNFVIRNFHKTHWSIRENLSHTQHQICGLRKRDNQLLYLYLYFSYLWLMYNLR